MPYHRYKKTTSRIIPPTAFWGWLQQQLQVNHLTEYRLAQDLHFDRHTLRAWRNGSLPQPQNCLKLADYFHVRLVTVYMLACIPLKAAWEITDDDASSLPDLTDEPDIWLAEFIRHLRQPETWKRHVLRKLFHDIGKDAP